MPELKAEMAKQRAYAYSRVGDIIKLHRASEQNARWAAVRTALRFRDTGTRHLANDDFILRDLAKQFQVHGHHVELFVDVVRCLCRHLPETRTEASLELLTAWKLMEAESQEADRANVSGN